MAFNPFTSFRKYQKFWMATVLLLCMITFVLCTGVGGDLSQRLLDKFRGAEGTPFAKVGGRSVYRKELDNLKDQRNMVNAFMKQACEAALKNISLLMADQKIPQEQRKELLPYWTTAKADLEKRLARPKYFGSGVKLEELLDFMVWQHEADRLGVTLVPDHVKQILLGTELMATITKFNLDQMYGVIRELKAVQRNPTEAIIVKALSDEYRVRIAQTAMEYSDRENMVRTKKVKFQIDSNPEVRIALSPAMLWDSFKANRSEFDVTLLPVLVDDFVKQVREPTEAELKSLFVEQSNARFDPAAPMPGFEIPASTRVEVVIGDPASPNFKRWSKAAVIMEATPPVWIPSTPLTTLTRYVAGPLALRSELEQQYAFIQAQAKRSEQAFERAPSAMRNEYLGAAWNHPDVYGALAFKLASAYPEAAASWIAGYAIAGFAQPSNFATAHLAFTAFGPVRHPREMEAGLAAEVKERVPVYATVVLAGTTATGYQALGMLHALDKEKYFPLDVVKRQLTEFLEQKLAKKWMRTNMIALRNHLEQPDNVGRKANFTRALNNDIQKMGLELRATKEFYNQFTIDKAPELQPLVKAFAKEYESLNIFEGRNLTPETALKEGDFYRLFFDSESFSVFGSTYKAKPWPPKVTPNKIALFGQMDPTKPQPIDFFETDVPETRFLFWKIDDKAGKLPESIDLVRDRVEKAWKFVKARETLALPKAKEIADRLQNSPTGFEPVLQLEALKLRRQRIDLKKLAPFYTERTFELAGFPEQPGFRDYTPFPLPKGTFTYARADMAKEILSLHNLKKPIELHDARQTKAADADAVKLDEFNKALFEAGAKNGSMVQILTNKPRNAFYVACVTSSPGPSMSEFHSVLKYAFPAQTFRGGGGPYEDGFFDRAFEEAGKEYRQALMVQLRVQTNSEILANPKERESFDSNESA